MAKAQHNNLYQVLPVFLRQLRESKGLTQRDIGAKLNKPQSYIFNCETGNRRVDVTEFISWVKACEVAPEKAFKMLLKELE